jgi:hypothetical protein
LPIIPIKIGVGDKRRKGVEKKEKTLLNIVGN